MLNDFGPEAYSWQVNPKAIGIAVVKAIAAVRPSRWAHRMWGGAAVNTGGRGEQQVATVVGQIDQWMHPLLATSCSGGV
jgi:hypothetical protein